MVHQPLPYGTRQAALGAQRRPVVKHLKFLDGLHFPTVHPRRHLRIPVRPSVPERLIPSDTLVALSPEQLYCVGDGPDGVRLARPEYASILFPEHPAGYAEYRTPVEHLHEALVVFGPERDIRVQVAYKL